MYYCFVGNKYGNIPKGHFGKIYPRSGLLVNHSVSFDGGVIDSGYRGIVKAIRNKS